MSHSLLLNRTAHLQLAHQVNVEQLVLLGHHHIAAVWYQVADLRHAELLHLQAERLVVAQRLDGVLHQEHQALVEVVVLRFHVLRVHLNAEDVFVEGAREVALQQLVVVDGLGCERTHENGRGVLAIGDLALGMFLTNYLSLDV